MLAQAQDRIASYQEEAVPTDTLTFTERLPADTTAYRELESQGLKRATFRPGFRESYRSPAFSYQETQPEKSPWQRFVDWLDKMLRKWFDLGDSESSDAFLYYAGRTCLVLVALLVAYVIARSLLRKEGRWIFARPPAPTAFRYEDAAPDLETADFSDLIDRALASGDRRLATRYHYLELLRALSLRGLIAFDKEKTNTAYQYEIRDEALRARFRYLSYLYEHIWYGHFEVDADAYAKTADAFGATIQNLP